MTILNVDRVGTRRNSVRLSIYNCPFVYNNDCEEMLKRHYSSIQIDNIVPPAQAVELMYQN